MASLVERISFLKQFLSRPTQVGAVLPSSRYLARALTRPLARRRGPVDILELGAGTGAVTRQIAQSMGANDRLDICEANELFAAHLQKHVLEQVPIRRRYLDGKIRLFTSDIQNVRSLTEYDFVISGLPFTAFDIRDVAEILRIIRRHAKPGCVFSYFEYIGIRPVLATVRPGTRGREFRKLSAYLSRQITNHQVQRDAVLRNFPPAHARHFKF